jgi:hypothetical protein
MKLIKKNSKLTFGKYKGLTVAEVIENDPSYILWLSRLKNYRVAKSVNDLAYAGTKASSFPRGRHLIEYVDEITGEDDADSLEGCWSDFGNN